MRKRIVVAWLCVLHALFCEKNKKLCEDLLRRIAVGALLGKTLRQHRQKVCVDQLTGQHFLSRAQSVVQVCKASKCERCNQFGNPRALQRGGKGVSMREGWSKQKNQNKKQNKKQQGIL